MWSAEFIAFVKHCLLKDPEKRLTAQEALIKHEKFFSKALDNQFVWNEVNSKIPQIK